MFTQCVVLATLIVATLSDITIHQEGHQHECINLSCPKGAFNDIDHPLIKENSKEQKCTICTQCTNFGYSVCAQPLSKALRFRRELDEDHCACANFVPETCKISQISSANKKDPNNRIFKICYLSTLRTPPKVYGLNQEKDFIVTIEQFWLEPYWKDFELSNLTLFYKFEVKSPEHCDEIGKVTTINDSSTPLHICTSSLPIEMNGENIPSDTSNAGKKSYDPTDNDDQYDEDENTPPEVEFGRDVFVGAKFVDIWYTVTVKRPHQLSFGERPFHDVTTVISSEALKHNLEPEVFGNGMGANNDASNDADDKKDKVPMSKETKAGHDSVSKVNIQSDEDDEEIDEDKEDEKDPIPSDNPGITDDSDEEIDETEDKEDGTDKENEGENETEDGEDSAATEEPEEADKDDEVDEDDKDKSEKETVDSEEDAETTTVAQEEDDEETTEAPTEESQEADETTVILDDDMASGNETESFFEQHFSNWPMMRVVFVLVGIASIILIAAACCYRYRGCCCYSDQQKVVTKTSNGYEYHVTGQSGQEMTPITKAIRSGIKDKAVDDPLDENILDATIKELQGIAESANVGEVQHGSDVPEIVKHNATDEEMQQLIEPESDDSQEMQDFKELMRISPRLWPCRLRIDAMSGNGHFGNINRGLLIDADKGTTHDVTVFSVKSKSTKQVPNNFEVLETDELTPKEMHLMVKTFSETVKAGLHPNIVSLLAVQQQPDRLLVVVDSLFYPDLLSLLRDSRVTRFDARLQKKTVSMISSDRLISMMLGCVYGCGHLIRHGITHPMLAACNVLVVGRALIKISGFGFADHRLLHQRQFETRPRKQRWLAPEYFTREFAPPTCGQSNIWSLGVLLWEIASFGGTPFAQFPSQEAFHERIREKQAFLPDLPYCSSELKSVMELCCTYDRESRPDMTDIIARKLEQISIDPEGHINVTIEVDNFAYPPVIAQLEQIVARL